MRLSVVLWVLIFATVALAQAPPGAQKPLGKNQIMDLVKAGMGSEELAKTVQERGIDFEPTDDYLQALRQAGAQDVLIKALRAVKPKSMTREQVLQLLVGGVPSQRVAVLVKQRGIDFMPDEKYLDTLRVAGAEEGLLAALRAARSMLAPGTVRENPKDGLKYVWIPPGTFVMGCSPGDSECGDDEKPSHRVTISKGFWMGQTEVTVGAYRRFALNAGQAMPPEYDYFERPSEEVVPIAVRWGEAREYCTWAGGRLPTEAEWEYAARGGSAEGPYDDLGEIAWYKNNSGGRTHQVGGKRANGFGLFDMRGNVWEWVNDWYDAKYYQNSPPRDPSGPASGRDRVLRGGSWNCDRESVRVSGRFGIMPYMVWGSNSGLRCVWEVRNP